MSTEVGPEHEETVLVDPYDDDGAVNSPGEGTPEAAGATTEDASEEAAAKTEAASVEAAATTEGADVKKFAKERHCLGVGHCVDTAMGRMDHGDRRRALNMCFQIVHTCKLRFSHS